MLEQHVSPRNSSENSRSFMGRCVPNFLLMVKENPGKEPVFLQGVRWHWWSVETERKWKRAHSHKSLPIPKPAREPSQLERYQSRVWPQLRLFIRGGSWVSLFFSLTSWCFWVHPHNLWILVLPGIGKMDILLQMHKHRRVEHVEERREQQQRRVAPALT